MDTTTSPRILTEVECWQLLDQEEVGRMAYHLAEEVHITPVNYATDRGSIVFRTAEGSKLLGVVMNEDVAFEVDRVHDEDESAWSVVARGRAQILTGDAARDADNLRLRPWTSPDKHNVVAIAVEEISGRHFHLARPWRHLRPEE